MPHVAVAVRADSRRILVAVAGWTMPHVAVAVRAALVRLTVCAISHSLVRVPVAHRGLQFRSQVEVRVHRDALGCTCWPYWAIFDTDENGNEVLEELLWSVRNGRSHEAHRLTQLLGGSGIRVRKRLFFHLLGSRPDKEEMKTHVTRSTLEQRSENSRRTYRPMSRWT